MSAVGIVMYCDGAAKTKNGEFATYGLHGYTFNLIQPKTGTGNPLAILDSDGYRFEGRKSELKIVSGTGKEFAKNFVLDSIPAEYKISAQSFSFELKPEVKVTPLTYIDAYGPVTEAQSNNRGEMTGFIRALEFAIKAKSENDDVGYIVINADSDYVINGASNYMKGWKTTNWVKSDGNEVKNVDLWKNIDELIQRLEEMEVIVAIRWIKGHSGNLGNVRADMLANISYNQLINDNGIGKEFFLESPAKKYWNASAERHPFLGMPICYYTVFSEFNEPAKRDDKRIVELEEGQRHVYYTGWHGKELHECGKPLSEASAAVLLLKDKVTAIENLKNFQCKHTFGNYVDISVANLTNLLSSKISSQIETFGFDVLVKGKKVDVIREEGSRDSTVAELVTPPLLSRICLQEIDLLYGHLLAYLTEKVNKPECPIYTVTDLTDCFYKDGALVKTLKENSKSVDVDLNYRSEDLKEVKSTKMSLRLGIEINFKNNLNAIANMSPKIYGITWHIGSTETALHIKHATIIECDGEYGIWAGYWANNTLVPLTD